MTKRSNLTTNAVITSIIPNLDIDAETISILQKNFNSSQTWKPPKGYLSASQIQQITKCSRSYIKRTIRKLRKENKVEIIKGPMITSSGQQQFVPFYKFKF